MKKLLAVIAAILICIAGLGIPAEAGSNPVYRYKVCNKHKGALTSGYVCQTFLAQRQADNQGFNINSAQVYISIPSATDQCNDGYVEQDPSAENRHFEVDAITASGNVVTKFTAETPDLKPSNECSFVWQWNGEPGGILTTDNPTIQVFFNYKLRLTNWSDAVAGVRLKVYSQPGGGTTFDCFSSDGADICTRTIV